MAWLEKRNGRYFIAWREGNKTRRSGGNRPPGERPGWTDKQIARAELGKFIRQQERGDEYCDPFKEHRTRSVADHLAVWVAELLTKSPNYSAQCDARISRLIKECGWRLLSDVTPEGFASWRQTAKSEIGHNRMPDEQLKKPPKLPRTKPEPVSVAPKTANHYLATLTTFLNWCVHKKRLAVNPIADVAKVNEAGGQRRRRRALTPEQVGKLLTAVPTEYRLLYRTILSTGLRRAEVAQLRWGDLHLDGPTAFIQLRAETTKAKRADAIPLRADMAREFRQARGDAGLADRVFHRVPRIKEHRRWLTAAGIDYVDEQNCRVDIHALRHTYGTLLSKAGVSPREAMSLMRHTDIRLTMGVYTDPRIFDLAGAVEKLQLPASEPAEAQAVATGTDGKTAPAAGSFVRHYARAHARAREGLPGRVANGVADGTVGTSSLARVDAPARDSGNENHSAKSDESINMTWVDAGCPKERAKGFEPSTSALGKRRMKHQERRKSLNEKDFTTARPELQELTFISIGWRKSTVVGVNSGSRFDRR